MDSKDYEDTDPWLPQQADTDSNGIDCIYTKDSKHCNGYHKNSIKAIPRNSVSSLFIIVVCHQKWVDHHLTSSSLDVIITIKYHPLSQLSYIINVINIIIIVNIVIVIIVIIVTIVIFSTSSFFSTS